MSKLKQATDIELVRELLSRKDVEFDMTCAKFDNNESRFSFDGGGEISVISVGIGNDHAAYLVMHKNDYDVLFEDEVKKLIDGAIGGACE